MFRSAGTRMWLLDLALAGSAAAWLGCGLSACGRAGASVTTQRAELAEEQRLYADLVEPLDAGQRALLRALAASDARPIAFHLESGGASPIADVEATTAVEAGSAVFWRLPAEGDRAHPTLAYTDPAALELVEVDAPDALSAGVVRREHGFSLVRARPVRTASGDDRLQIYRFDFTVDAAGAPIPSEVERLTAGADGDSAPVPMADGRVAFLRRHGEDRARLMTVPLAGGKTEPLFAEQPFDARLPRLVDDRLLFAGDADGAWRLLAFEPTTRSWREYSGPELPRRGPRRALLAGRVAEGRVLPQLVELPAVYDLDAILALVAARNPSVNKRRALLAAALVEARQLRLAKLPTLTVGLGYTPVEGVLTSTTVAAGDVLAVGLARGLLGLVQPLLELPRVNALSEAGKVRAEIARDVLADELNTRLSEAAEWYFRAAGYRGVAAVRAEQLGNAVERHRYLAALAGEKEVGRARLLAADQDLAAASAGETMERKRLDYACARLRELADLPPDAPLALADDPFRFDQASDGSFAELRRLALLNHPRLRAARRALIEAFYERKGDPRYEPNASFSADYGHVRRHAVDPVDDYIALSLRGELPLARMKDGDLRAARWRALANAVELDTREQQQAVSLALDEAMVEHEQARADLSVAHAALATKLEDLRVARLHLGIGPPNDRTDVDRDDLLAAHEGWYRALAATISARSELAVRRSRLYRELGLAGRLRDDAEPLKASRLAQAGAARWLWQARAVIRDEAACTAFLDDCATRRTRRVYAYLEAESRLLDDAHDAERLALFIDRCAARDIEVWGLLGEPEWLEPGRDDEMALGARRVAAFNARFAPFAPRLAGVKLDIEPHTLPAWSRDGAGRDQLATRWLDLIGAARRELPALPLWADCPPQFFRPELGDLVERLSGLVDGVTLMAYGDREAWIDERADEALARWPKALELGLELGAGAPAGETLAGWRADEIEALRIRLVERHRGDARFAGLALHEAVAIGPMPAQGAP